MREIGNGAIFGSMITYKRLVKMGQNVFFQNIIHLVPKKLIMGTKKMGTLNGHSATLCSEFYMNVHRLTTHHKK